MSRAVRPLDTRDRLVLNHLQLVNRIAGKLKPRLPPCFELDDLVQAGMLGLMEAASQFDPGRFPGVAFGAFARRRIRGAIQDSIGMHNTDTRRTTRERRWAEATRPPINEHNQVVGVNPESGTYEDYGETRDTHARADTAIEERERRDLVRGAISSLDRRQAKVIQMHYGVKETELKAIAHTPGVRVGPARVSQLHTSALRNLREYMAARGLKRAA